MKRVGNKIVAEREDTLIYCKNDKGSIIDGVYYGPYSFRYFYPASSLDTDEKINEIYEEVSRDEFDNIKINLEKELREETSTTREE